jgi:hypothetical protein
VATALGSESAAVKRAEESLSALAEARLAVKAKDEENVALISTGRSKRKKLMAKFVLLVENEGRIKEAQDTKSGTDGAPSEFFRNLVLEI